MKKSLVEPQHSVAPRTHCLLTRARATRCSTLCFSFCARVIVFFAARTQTYLFLNYLFQTNMIPYLPWLGEGKRLALSLLIIMANVGVVYMVAFIYSWKQHKTMEVEIRIEISYVEISYVGCCELCAIGADKNLSWLWNCLAFYESFEKMKYAPSEGVWNVFTVFRSKNRITCKQVALDCSLFYDYIRSWKVHLTFRVWQRATDFTYCFTWYNLGTNMSDFLAVFLIGGLDNTQFVKHVSK